MKGEFKELSRRRLVPKIRLVEIIVVSLVLIGGMLGQAAVVNAELTLVKSLQSNNDADGSGTVSVGDTLTYQFVATNTGDQTLSNVTISDPLAGLSALSCTPAQPSALAPAGSMTCTATYVVTVADVTAGSIDNTATADSNETPPVTDNVAVPVPFVAIIPALERDALIALYNSTNGDSWTDSTGWKDGTLHTDGFALPGTECSWQGVLCDGGENNVVTLDLFSNNLNGTIPTQLANLVNLQALRLYSNQLSGSIPTELGNLKNLQYISLRSNQLRSEDHTYELQSQ